MHIIGDMVGSVLLLAVFVLFGRLRGSGGAGMALAATIVWQLSRG